MKTKNKIIAEIEAETPEISRKIEDSVNWQAIKLRSEVENGNKNKKEKSRFIGMKKLVLQGLAACIIICAVLLPIILITSQKPLTADAYTIILSVNPRVKFVADKNDTVTRQTALNEDGAIILYNKNYVGKNIGDATTALLYEMEKTGINLSNVKLSVFDEKTKKTLDEKREKVISAVRSVLDFNKINVINLTEKELDEIEDYYENNNISDYEKNLITKFKQKVIALAEKKIADAEALIAKLQPYNIDKDEVIDNFPFEKEIKTFVSEYKTECKIDFNAVKYEDVYEFIEELEEAAKELKEEIGEINEETEDYGELLEDLIELVKEKLFEEDD